MLEWWMKNSVAVIAIVLPATVVLLWLSPAIHATTLCKVDDPCIREWISATSGWAAFVIGAVSLISLRLQTGAAIKSNENNAKIALRRSYALAEKVEAMSEFLLGNALRLESDVKKASTTYMIGPGKSDVVDQLNLVIDIIDSGGFVRFEEEIEFPTMWNAEFLRRRIIYLRGTIEQLGDIALATEFKTEALHFCQACMWYSDFCKAAAKKFIEEAAEMMGKPHARASRNGTP